MNLKFKRGFTLIELLVVISIIGLLSSVVLASLGSARAKGRDASRVQTIGQVKNALELYYADFKAYPTVSGNTISGLFTPGTGPLLPYIKSLSPNFAITGGAVPTYYSSANNYELLIQTESGGAFNKSIGCFTSDYNTYSATSKYCYGNNPTVSLIAGGGGSNPAVTFSASADCGESGPPNSIYVAVSSNCSPNISLSWSDGTSPCQVLGGGFPTPPLGWLNGNNSVDPTYSISFTANYSDFLGLTQSQLAFSCNGTTYGSVTLNVQ